MFSLRPNRIVLLVLFILSVLILLTHYHISKVSRTNDIDDSLFVSSALRDSHNSGDGRYVKQRYDDHQASNQRKFQSLESGDWNGDDKLRAQDALRIRESVIKELRALESELHKIQSERSSETIKLEAVKYKIIQAKSQLSRFLLSIEEAQHQLQEIKTRNDHENRINWPSPIKAPRPIENSDKDSLKAISHTSTKRCSLSQCFDYSRCSLVSNFLTYVYPFILTIDDGDIAFELAHTSAQMMDQLLMSPHHTMNSSNACIFIVLISTNHLILRKDSISILQSKLEKLEHWANDGQNHLLINLNPSIDLLDSGLDSKRSLLAQTYFKSSFRPFFDIILHLAIENDSPFQKHLFSVEEEVKPLCPSKRNFLLTFLENSPVDKVDPQIMKLLDSLRKSNINDEVPIIFDCAKASNCFDHLLNSTFSLVFSPSFDEFSTIVGSKIIMMLRNGVIPVLIDDYSHCLPLHEVIDWSKVLIKLPAARIPEVPLILKSIHEMDILDRRRHGRMIFDRYFSSISATSRSIVSLLRDRLNYPSMGIEDSQSTILYHRPFTAQIAVSNDIVSRPDNGEPEEILGPIEAPFRSETFLRNYSLKFFHTHDQWNSIKFDPFFTYPSTPFDPVLPSEAKFIGSDSDFRPIGSGWGGSGKEFSEALGGNWPREQFTIVILTYEREKILLESLQRLKGLPYLNKVIVIWNSVNKPPSPDIVWPELGVPLVVVKAEHNSLNNRFKPYDIIETDAILSMDDDAHLRHDEIIFGFR